MSTRALVNIIYSFVVLIYHYLFYFDQFIFKIEISFIKLFNSSCLIFAFHSFDLLYDIFIVFPACTMRPDAIVSKEAVSMQQLLLSEIVVFNKKSLK